MLNGFVYSMIMDDNSMNKRSELGMASTSLILTKSLVWKTRPIQIVKPVA